MNYKLFTSESVSASHPDKICDQISDAILDECLRYDPQSRVAVEAMVTVNRIILAGEVATAGKVDFEKIARGVVEDLGYNRKIYGFDYRNAKVATFIHTQSQDIAKGVLMGGAGDQGMMFGYACGDTPELIPLPIALAREIVKRIDLARKNKVLAYLRPDGKSEVTVEYQNHRPKKVTKAVTAVPHDPKLPLAKVAKDIFEVIIRPAIKKYGYSIDFKNTVCNGTGKWEIGGPSQDTGVTGRKIAVDTYGSMARIGGGCFSGKDSTKVDRSAAYAARFIAKNIVAKSYAKKCEIQLAYVIGQAEPITKAIETFGTEKVALSKIEQFAWSLLDLSVKGIIDGLKLTRPIYRETASYGHFGWPAFSWEKIAS